MERGKLLPILTALADRPYWYYGRDEYPSKLRLIISSVQLTAVGSDGSHVATTHIILEERSQWVIGQNVTSHFDVPKIGEQSLVLSGKNGALHRNPTLDNDMHQHISMETFNYLDTVRTARLLVLQL